MDSIIQVLVNSKYHLPIRDYEHTDSYATLIAMIDNYAIDIINACTHGKNDIYGQDFAEKILEKKNILDEEIELIKSIVSAIKEYSVDVRWKDIINNRQIQDNFSRLCELLSDYLNYDDYYQLRYSFVPDNIFYRIARPRDNKPVLERIDFLNTPTMFSRNDSRFNYKENPCIYLASMPELCWEETRRPSPFFITKVQVPSSLKIFDLFYPPCSRIKRFLDTRRRNAQNEGDIKDLEKQLNKIIFSFPFAAACSISTVIDNEKVYYFPQLLMDKVKAYGFDAIQYHSSAPSDKPDEALIINGQIIYNCDRLCGYNLVLVSSDSYDSEGYDTRWRSELEFTSPLYVENSDNKDWCFKSEELNDFNKA